MAEHRALRALKALKTILIAADTTAGGNVEIGRAAQIEEQDAIDINPGDDEALNEFGVTVTDAIDSNQTVYVDLHARSTGHEELLLERVFALRAQTHIAILEDATLGLPFVFSIRYGGTREFDYELSGDRLGSMRTVWTIAYRMQYDDPTT